MSARDHAVRLTLLATLGIAVALAIACGPGGFDGLTGGARDAGADTTLPDVADDTLPPPRPLSPGTFTFISTARPVFKWELSDPLTGAILELCTSRKCETVAKSFAVTGRSLALTEDLEPATYFWRLRGRAPGKVGTRASATWQVLVRGPAASGSSTALGGAIVDVNGDGFADLVTTSVPPPPDDDFQSLLVYFGGPDGPATRPSQRFELGPITSIAGGMDVNGDGYTDVVVGIRAATVTADGGAFPADAQAPTYYYLTVLRGSEKGLLVAPEEPRLLDAATLGQSVREAGDVNGDGYGDVIAATTRGAYVLLGGPNSLSGPLVPLVADALFAPAPDRVALGGFDLNSDGFADVVVGSAKNATPSTVFFGAPGGVGRETIGVDMRDGSLYRTSALGLAALDFDGDATVDLAFSATLVDELPPLGVVTDLCVIRGPAPLLRPLSCVTGSVGKAFGTAFVGADMDGDKRDELIFRAGPGLTSFKYTEPDSFDEFMSYGYGDVRGLALLYPGRPGPALWVATTAQRINVVEGTKTMKVIAPPAAESFSALLR